MRVDFLDCVFDYGVNALTGDAAVDSTDVAQKSLGTKLEIENVSGANILPGDFFDWAIAIFESGYQIFVGLRIGVAGVFGRHGGIIL